MFGFLFKVKFLSEFDGDRENNFTVVRFLLALLVLIGHSFPISGNGSDPVTMLIRPHAWIGSIAVGGFFAVSGFLVSASIANRSALDFAISRVLRLYPAVIAYSLVAILIIGPIASGVPLAQYFQQNPWVNMWNATLWEWNYNLPYGFPGRPFEGATNGSTWTLPAELRCYVAVFCLGVIGVFSQRPMANVILLSILYLTKSHYALLPLFGSAENFKEPLLFFVVGALFWTNRALIPLNWCVCALMLGATYYFAGTQYYFYAYIPTVAYVLFMLAYMLPHFDMDRFGDISYGVYIYAWPMQQLVWVKGQSGYVNALLAMLLVLPIAYLSWRFVESPALKLRKSLGTGGALWRKALN
ncbi:acyltransferase [Pseudomonas nitroreducens]|uniref:Acyltransferase n=1 Tax=Pseudomonas nitroreducens TaxID=46680 RepID=A0A5R9A1H6_PSENT|nr:acyltransferase [Pseudomonas nitroreducens]TLP72472.1 acyltransferase [Pseudomonas nitroreducens]